MKVLDYLDNVIANDLLLKQLEDKKTRPQTDRLTGSILGWPLQDQILKIIGIPQKSFEPYTLRKFERGHHVEAWVMNLMPGLLGEREIIELAKSRGAIDGIRHDQASIQYRGATGHVDGIVDMAFWDEPQLGIIPHEVKSITNLDFNKNFGPKVAFPKAKYHHQLQIGLYAMALKTDFYMIHYIASDDYRIKSLLYPTKEIASDVDNILDTVEEQLESGIIPAFEARETWQANPLYQNYPGWNVLTSEESMEKLEEEFPEAYTKLQSYAKKGGE